MEQLEVLNESGVCRHLGVIATGRRFGVLRPADSSSPAAKRPLLGKGPDCTHRAPPWQVAHARSAFREESALHTSCATQLRYVRRGSRGAASPTATHGTPRAPRSCGTYTPREPWCCFAHNDPWKPARSAQLRHVRRGSRGAASPIATHGTLRTRH